MGTLGMVVQDAHGNRFGLSNAHVLSDGQVVQPHLSGFSIGPVTSCVLDSQMDAGLVSLNGTRPSVGGIDGIGPLHSTFDPIPLTRIPLPVEIVGACSGRSSGFVTSVSATIPITYPSGRTIWFSEQLHIVSAQPGREFSKGGDSGAVLFDTESHRAIGLLFAGEPSGAHDFAIATPIRRVLDRLGVTFL